MTLDQVRNGLRTVRAARSLTREQIEGLSLQLNQIADGPDAVALRDRMVTLRKEFDGARATEVGQFGSQLDPRQNFFELDGAVPVLLFPLRIQTRFDANTLLVRVYPDEISIQSHDPRLTEDERACGALFWSAPEARAEANDLPEVKIRRDVWRGNVARFGLRRAAWIMQATDPQHPPPAVGEPAAPLRVPATWTLPERLVFRFYGEQDHLLGEVLGQPIPDGLEMAFDPTRSDLGFGRKDGDISYGPELLWQVDLSTAIAVGMAVAVPLDLIGNVRRIERLIVMGVRLASDELESTKLLQQLIEDHRFTDGFGVLPQGTPTNVTEGVEPPAPPEPDALLDWLRGPGAYADGGKATLYQDECDGLRLAHALGISPETTRYLDNANQKDAAEAVAMKRALWAGTLGYYAQQMLAPGMDFGNPFLVNHNADMLVMAARFFFTHFVFGRGPLPALRVGDQPYGILPVSSSMLKAEPDHSGSWPDGFLEGFMDQALDKLHILSKAWLDAIAEISCAGAGPGADARLLDVLTQQASSVEYHSEYLIGQEYLQTYADFKDPAKGRAELANFTAKLKSRYDSQFVKAFPALFSLQPHVFTLSFFGGFWQSTLNDIGKLNRSLSVALSGDVVDHLPYSETSPIAPTYPNYIAQMADADLAGVRRGIQRVDEHGTSSPVTALLYLLLRHSYLHEYAFAAMRLYHHFQGTPWPAFREKEIYNAGFKFDRVYWDYLEHSETWSFGGPVPQQATALQLLENRKALRDIVPRWSDHFGDVDDLHEALKLLADLPTARLERLFAEHVDLAGYRLDAWITGHVYQRLVAARIMPGQPIPKDAMFHGVRYDLNAAPIPRYEAGIFLGAYGWVEGIEADATPVVAADLPAELLPVNGKVTTRDADNYGFVQGPSLNHAVTAALLRNASVSEPDTTAYNVDLSSARVREALWVIDGVRNGQAPAALLGYKFERGLRERDVTLQQYLPKLRVAFPMPRQPDTVLDPAESVPAKDVVNGLRMVQALRAGTLDAELAFIVADADRSAIVALAAAVLDTLDACSDLMLAESVHQAAQGNYERAGGVVTASGEFTHVPSEFQVLETPRSGTALTHRLLLAMNYDVGAPAPSTSPRSRLEPQLNRWLGSVLGPLGQLSCAIVYTFKEGDNERLARQVVTLDQLEIEPIDLLFAIDVRTVSEFAGRLDLVARAQFEAEHGAAVVEAIELDYFGAVAPDSHAVGELLPLLDSLRAILTHARPATRRDFVPPNVLYGLTNEAIDGIDTAELVARVLGVSAANPGAIGTDSLWGQFTELATSFDALDGLGANELQQRLLAAAQFGIPGAIPVLGSELSAQAARIKEIIRQRRDRVLGRWVPPIMPATQVLALCRDMANTMLGGNYPLMPRVQPVEDIATAALPTGAPDADRIGDWLFLASTIRESAAKLQQARVLGTAASRELAPLRIFQWPVEQKGWIADPPPPGQVFSGDLVSIAVQPADAFDPSKTIAALHVDEWHEVIPSATETTGIALNYNAPHAEPPQTLLLAVSQRKLGNNTRWTWEELVASVEQALTLAKVRAVGPDELRRTPLDAILPATMMAETSTPATISTRLFANISDKIAVASNEIWKMT